MAKIYPSIDVIQNMNPRPTEGEWTLLKFLKDNFDDDYEIFYQPFLNGDRPDVVLVHKGGGIMIFEVKDWDLNNYEVASNGVWRVRTNNARVVNNPSKQVLKYKENLYNIHIKDLAHLKLMDYKHWYIVNCAVYFHCSTESDAKSICYGAHPEDKYKTFLNKNITILGHDSLQKEKIEAIFDKQWISRESKYFTDDLYNNFIRILRPSYHTIEEGTEIHYSDEQKALIESVPGQRKRIKGVAGSGKTMVLAKRAVNAHKQTNEDVLILTYNITLKNYIHDCISRVRENFDWRVFHISNYHDFINATINNVEKEFPVRHDTEGNYIPLSDYEIEKLVYSNVNLFDGYEGQICKYRTILIDEAQDYKEPWIRIILKYFAHPNAEIVAFADEKQNIYCRDLDNNRMPVIPIQIGPWDRTLNKSFRLSKKIALLCEDFQRSFFSWKYAIDQNIETDTQLDLFEEPKIEYYNVTQDSDRDISSLIYKIVRKNQLNSNDVTILSSQIENLRSINDELQKISMEKTNITFETSAEFARFTKYDITRGRLEHLRKNRKSNFWMNRGTFKLSTIHSFKGWESPALFIIIESNVNSNSILSASNRPDKFSDELVYTGLTRCRNKLFIINRGNARYDSFFSNNKKLDGKYAVGLNTTF